MNDFERGPKNGFEGKDDEEKTKYFPEELRRRIVECEELIGVCKVRINVACEAEGYEALPWSKIRLNNLRIPELFRQRVKLVKNFTFDDPEEGQLIYEHYFEQWVAVRLLYDEIKDEDVVPKEFLVRLKNKIEELFRIH